MTPVTCGVISTFSLNVSELVFQVVRFEARFVEPVALDQRLHVLVGQHALARALQPLFDVVLRRRRRPSVPTGMFICSISSVADDS